jgi:amidophosphoribosyltransferase
LPEDDEQKENTIMGGIFGVASKSSCILDLFFGIDYHSHLGTRRGGMAVYDKKRGFDRVIHNIENAPFRTKFDGDIGEMEGNLGIGCISDNEPQPLLVRSHLGNFAITTVGKINNMDELIANCFKNGCTHFLEMSGGSVNPTEMVAALINQKDNMIEGIRYAQEVIEGSMTMLILTPKGILAARDRLGRTPLIVGKKEDACCVSFESFAYLNLGYEDLKELGPGEIVAVTPDGVETLQKPGEEMRICSFLWVYYGYPTSAYEGVNVEEMRYHCGDMLARRDRGEVNPDIGSTFHSKNLAGIILIRLHHKGRQRKHIDSVSILKNIQISVTDTVSYHCCNTGFLSCCRTHPDNIMVSPLNIQGVILHQAIHNEMWSRTSVINIPQNM